MGSFLEQSLKGQVKEQIEVYENSQITPIKRYYTVFPKSGTKIPKTNYFIKTIIGAADVMTWTDVHGEWVVLATADEVVKLQGYANIDRVAVFKVPRLPEDSHPFAATTRTLRDPAGVDRIFEIKPPRTDELGYGVFPRDGKNKTAIDATEQFFQQLLGHENLGTPLYLDGELAY